MGIRATHLGRWALVSLVWLATAGCVCNDSDIQCNEPSDCRGLPFTHPDCTEDEGRWSCQSNLCVEVCDDGCAVYQDCEGNPWPEDGSLDCDAASGHWECEAEACVAACNTDCNTDADCALWDWDASCEGSWDCPQGRCEATCDEVACGDGRCDAPAGETDASCPTDCGAVGCDEPMDCIGNEDWDLPCDGLWSCEVGACVATCDYTTCGDGSCDPDLGEDVATCIPDCLETCQWPTDCVHETWSQLCQGRHTCFLGTCEQTCDSNGCGNGTCDEELGETSDSCYRDCLGGPCAEITDCLGYPWYEDCDGRWDCLDGAGACEPLCDPDCGDGTCDPLRGESAATCPTDCDGYDCDRSEACDGLTLPDGCSAWLCVNQSCTPQCSG